MLKMTKKIAIELEDTIGFSLEDLWEDLEKCFVEGRKEEAYHIIDFIEDRYEAYFWLKFNKEEMDD